MAFPTSNLPTGALPWGREVEKQINTVVSTVKSNEVNNAARDNQLAASLKRVQAAQVAADAAFAATGIVSSGLTALETDVNTLETNVYFPGTTTINGGNIRTGTIGATQISASYVYAGNLSASQITTGSLSGNRISGGVITGTVIQSAYSGQRVIVNSSNISFYNSANSFTGSIYGSDYGGSNSVTIEVSDGSGVVAAYSGGAYLGNNDAAYFQVFGGNSYVNGGEFRSTASVNTFYNSTTARSTLNVIGALNTDSTLRRSLLAGGALTGASITADGYFVRTSSSERYKQDIQDLVLDYEDILSLTPKIFRRKDEVETNPNARYYAGFIAEDIAESPLDVFAFYQSEKDGGLPDGVHYSELTSALLLAIKHQDTLIKALEIRLTQLEGN